MQIPQAIKELRAALGLTQVQLARVVALAPITIAHLESGHKRPHPQSLVSLAQVAFENDRRDLAELFLGVLPGVREGLLVPSWLPLPTTAPDSDYPRMLFHRTKDPAIVHSRTEERLRGPEWARVQWPEPVSGSVV